MVSYSTGGQSAEGVLPAASVVGPLDPGDDRDPQFLAGLPLAAVEDFFCSSAKKDSIAALSPAVPYGWLQVSQPQ